MSGAGGAEGRVPDVDHLQTIADADPGLYFVALHTFVEGFIDDMHSSPSPRASFGEKLDALRQELDERGQLTAAARRIIGIFRASQPIAARLGRAGGDLSRAELAAATHAFLAWCTVVGFEPATLRHIRAGLARRLGSIGDHPGAELEALRGDHRRLAARIESLGDAPDPGDDPELSAHLAYLQRATTYTRSRRDYAQSVLELDPEQRETLERIGRRGDFVISGPPGSGKTVVLLHALDRELSELDQELGMLTEGEVLLLTYTRTLVRFSGFLARIFGRHRSGAGILTVDAFLLARLKLIREDAYIVFPSRVREIFGDLLDAALLDPAIAARVADVDALWELIDGGAGEPTDASEANALRGLRDALAARMEETGAYSRPVARDMIRRDMRARQTVPRRILVDEAQDLSPGDLALLAEFSDRGLIVAGDDLQRIYRAGLRFSDLGLQVRGRSRTLQANHRNSAAIWRLAARYAGVELDLPAVRRFGPEPEILRVPDLQLGARSASRRVALLVEQLGYEPENIAVLVGRSDDLPPVIAQLEERGMRVSSLRSRSFDFARTRGVRVTTMHSAKGLEFPCVILLAGGFSRRDDLTRDEQDRMERNLLYVAMTRAMDQLHILIPEPVAHASIAGLLEEGLQADSLAERSSQ